MAEQDELLQLAKLLNEKASTGELEEMLTALNGLYSIMTDNSLNQKKDFQTKEAYNKIVSYQIRKFIEKWGDLFNDVRRFTSLKHTSEADSEIHLPPEFLKSVNNFPED